MLGLPSRDPAMSLGLKIKETCPDPGLTAAHVRLRAHDRMATNSPPSASITGAKHLCLAGCAMPCGFKALPRAHLNVSSRQCIVNTRMAVRRLFVCCPSSRLGTWAQEAEVKRPHRITQCGSPGDWEINRWHDCCLHHPPLSQVLVHVVTQQSAHLVKIVFNANGSPVGVLAPTRCCHLIIEAVKHGNGHRGAGVLCDYSNVRRFSKVRLKDTFSRCALRVHIPRRANASNHRILIDAATPHGWSTPDPNGHDAELAGLARLIIIKVFLIASLTNFTAF